MTDMSQEWSIHHQHEQVLATCKAMLAGNISIILGSRMLAKLRFELNEERNPDFLIFEAIASETDHLPIGEVRQYWAESALLRIDEEIKRVEDFYRGVAFEGCHALITKFGPCGT